MNLSISTYLVFICYILLVIFIGYRTSRLSNSDFLVAGQKQPYWVVGSAYVATFLSATSFLGIPGAVYHEGFVQNGTYFGSTIGYIAGLAIFGPLLRRFGRVTIPDFLGERYDSKLVRGFSSILIFVGFFLYISAQVMGMAFLFELLFDVPYSVAVLIAIGIVLLYTFLGGMLAVAYIDVIQLFFTWISVVILVILAMNKVGGMTQLVAKIEELHPTLLTADGGTGDSWMIWSFILVWLIGTLARADTLSRAYLAKSEREVYKAILFSTPFIWICGFLFLFIGMAGKVIFPALEGMESENIYFMLADNLALPIFVGIVFAGFLASAQSTASGQLMVAALAVGRDIYGEMIGPLLKKRTIENSEVVKVTRGAIVIMSIAMFTFASLRLTWLLDISSLAMAIMGPAFLVTWLGGFFWRRATKFGAVAALVVGAIIATFTWVTNFSIPEIPWLVPPLLSLIVTAVAYIVASLMSKPTEKSLDVFNMLKQKTGGGPVEGEVAG